jgi:uncharacterized protein (DUF433 family)
MHPLQHLARQADAEGVADLDDFELDHLSLPEVMTPASTSQTPTARRSRWRMAPARGGIGHQLDHGRALRRADARARKPVDLTQLDPVTFDPATMDDKPGIRGLRVAVGRIVGTPATGHATADVHELYPSQLLVERAPEPDDLTYIGTEGAPSALSRSECRCMDGALLAPHPRGLQVGAQRNEAGANGRPSNLPAWRHRPGGQP